MIPDSLLAAIIANKSDDLPRLIAADWLDEHGESERAEFIRVQCLPCQCAYTHHNRARMCERCQREKEVATPLNLQRWGVGVLARWTRGFVSAITCSWQGWLTHADAILKATPLERVRLTTMPNESRVWARRGQSNTLPDYPGIAFELPSRFERDEVFEYVVRSTGIPPHLINPPIYHGTE